MKIDKSKINTNNLYDFLEEIESYPSHENIRKTRQRIIEKQKARANTKMKLNRYVVIGSAAAICFLIVTNIFLLTSYLSYKDDNQSNILTKGELDKPYLTLDIIDTEKNKIEFFFNTKDAEYVMLLSIEDTGNIDNILQGENYNIEQNCMKIDNSSEIKADHRYIPTNKNIKFAVFVLLYSKNPFSEKDIKIQEQIKNWNNDTIKIMKSNFSLPNHVNIIKKGMIFYEN